MRELAAEDRQLIPYVGGGRLVFGQMLRAVGGDAVELFRAFGRGGGVSHLLEIGERRIDHAGTGCVDAAGMLFHFLDDFIAMTRFLAEQQQDDQLQVPRSEHHGRAPARAAPAEPAAEGASEESASAAPSEMPVAASPCANMI